MRSVPASRPQTATGRRGRLLVRVVVITYVAVLLILPLGAVAYRALSPGIVTVWRALTMPQGIPSGFSHALLLTLGVCLIAVPLNTLFGVSVALLMTKQGWLASLLDATLDLPVAVSPVIVGLALVLVYGRTGWFGAPLAAAGISVIFSPVGIVVASAFVSLPYVARSVHPTLVALGHDRHDAAATLGASPWSTFFSITLPAIRWSVAYGVTMTTARVLGEFGAVSIVSGDISSRTQTLTLFVSDQFSSFNQAGAFGASLIIVMMSLGVLGILSLCASRATRGAAP